VEQLVDVVRMPGKCVYLANRHPRLTRVEFAERWKRHASIGGSLDPRIHEVAALRYCLTEAPGELLPGASDEHDGVALLGLRSVLSTPAMASLMVDNEVAYADELRTFERPVQDVTLLTASELLVAGDETAVVVIDFARRRPEVAPTTYFRTSDEARESDLAESGLLTLGLRRWVRNALVGAPVRGFAYDAVHELWFDSLDAVAGARKGIETLLARSESTTDRRTSTLLVTTVIERIGPDLPACLSGG
jgi:hypothetical protein